MVLLFNLELFGWAANRPIENQSDGYSMLMPLARTDDGA
jgi:hypothetical protein